MDPPQAVANYSNGQVVKLVLRDIKRQAALGAHAAPWPQHCREPMTAAKPYMSDAELIEVQELLDEAHCELAQKTFVHAFLEGGKSAINRGFRSSRA